MKIFGFLSHLDLNLYLFRAPIMKALLEEGHKVYAICPKGDKNDALLALGCEVINYDIDRKSLNPFREKQAINSIYDAIKYLHIDILHTFTAKPNIYGTMAGKKAGIPIILNLVEGLGSFYTRNTPKNRLIQIVMERLYKKTFLHSQGCVFVNSSDPAYMVEKKIIDTHKVKIIKSVGVDTAFFSMEYYTHEKILELKKRLNLENKLIVLMVARAIWDKGIKEYYEAASHLRQKYSDSIFVLVGGVDEGNPSCVDEAFLQEGSVLWLGHRDDVRDLTAISDIYVLPSYKEGLPVTLLEASSMAKPIVTTYATGCKDVVDDGINGFLVPIKDATTLASKIEVLLQDSRLRTYMGEAGRQKAIKEFDVKQVVAQYMEYYETFF